MGSLSLRHFILHTPLQGRFPTEGPRFRGGMGLFLGSTPKNVCGADAPLAMLVQGGRGGWGQESDQLRGER